MAISLQKNASVSLTKEAGGSGLTKIALGVGWDAAKKKGGFLGGLFGGGAQEIDLDASCLVFDAQGTVTDLVWFQQLVSTDGSIRHSGDNLTGEGDGDDETISIDLTRLPATVETVVLTVNSFRGQTFNEVDNAFGRVIDLSTNRELARFDITDAGTHTGIILASIKRAGGEWVFRALGERTNGRTAHELAAAASRLI
ncbi:MAG: TerD family protein [Sphingomonas sp.]